MGFHWCHSATEETLKNQYPREDHQDDAAEQQQSPDNLWTQAARLRNEQGYAQQAGDHDAIEPDQECRTEGG